MKKNLIDAAIFVGDEKILPVPDKISVSRTGVFVLKCDEAKKVIKGDVECTWCSRGIIDTEHVLIGGAIHTCSELQTVEMPEIEVTVCWDCLTKAILARHRKHINS